MLKVELIAYTPNPEKVVAAAAKLCYSKVGAMQLLDGLDEEKTQNFLRMLGQFGHASPIEHASFTFAVEGVSRALLAQITRHRIASFSVQSQRYVRLEDFHYVIPPEIENDVEAKGSFIRNMEDMSTQYLDMANLLTNKYMLEGMDKKSAEKKANEDARFLLPNACETKFVVTMNARSLHNFFKLRCCNRAQWEIRSLAREMYRLVYQVAPNLFANAGPSCVCGKCEEGQMSCGQMEQVRKDFKELKGETNETN